MTTAEVAADPTVSSEVDASEDQQIDAGPDLDAAMRRFVPKQLAARLNEGGQIDQEHRLVTALFADVSGFTALSTRVDAETLAAIIDPVIARMSAIVGKYEGYINSFAGDAILALFGAPIGHEDDADRALMAALEMHQAIDVAVAQLHEEGADLKLHIGVNTGHVVARLIGDELRTDYSVLGESVNLAQRLESAAPTGETYIGQMTWELTRDRFDLESVGELTVKGKSEPIEAWRLVGRKAGSDGPRAGASRALIGRQAELAAMVGAVDRLAAGVGGVVQLTGEPGVGKSRLTKEAAAHARGVGVRWLEARCISYGASVAYFPYAELLRNELGITYDQHPAESSLAVLNGLDALGCRDAAPFVARMLGLPAPDNAAAVDDLTPEAFRRGLHEALAGWLGALAKDAPLVFALEDLHWADEASTDLTRHLAGECAKRGTLLFLTGRPEAASTLVGLAEEVPQEQRVVVALERLDETDTAELVAACLGGPPPDELVAVAAERAAGNPFFVEELVRSLTDHGDVVYARTAWRMRDGWDASAIPPTVEEVLSGRMDMLTATAVQVLQMAAVIGRRVNLDLLEGMAEDVTDLHGALEQLVDAAFLDRAATDDEDQLIFRHALVVDVAYSRLARRQRRELHRRLAETGEALYGAADDTIDLLARHFYLAEAGAKAVDYLGRAADRARHLFANDEAIVHLERAVELARQSARLRDDLIARLLDLAEVHDLTGSYDEALARYEEVWGTRPSEVRAWRGLASVARRRGEIDHALALTADALAAPDLAAADLSPIWLERAWTFVASSHFFDGIEAAQRGIEATADPTSPDVGQLLLQQAQAEFSLGKLEEARAHADEAHEIFEHRDDLRGRTMALRVLSTVQSQLGQNDEAAATLHRAMELAERTGNADEIIGCLVNLGYVELRRGDLDLAVKYDLLAVQRAQQVGYAMGAAVAQANLSEVLLERGDLGEAMLASEEAIALAEVTRDLRCTADALHTLARIHLADGRPRDALDVAERAVALFIEAGDLATAEEAIDHAAQAAEEVGDAERARSLRDRARSLNTGD